MRKLALSMDDVRLSATTANQRRYLSASRRLFRSADSFAAIGLKHIEMIDQDVDTDVVSLLAGEVLVVLV